MPKEKIHLTLSVLRLFTDEDEKSAKRLLDSIMRDGVK